MGKTSYRDRQQTRHIKYKTKGKKQTLPIKDEKELHRISKYLLVKRDRAKQKGQLRRYETYYRNYMLFMVAINVGFRTEDLLQLEWVTSSVAICTLKKTRRGNNRYSR